MAECPQFVIWNPVPPGSTLKAESSGDGDDYNSGVRIVPENGAPTQWTKGDLDPGPASQPLESQGYGVRVTVTTGPSAPSAEVHMWIEGPTGTKLFECTWTCSNPDTQTRATVAIVPQ